MNNIIESNNRDELIRALPENTKLNILANIYGFSSLPPSIADFIEDDYYLGRTYGNGVLYPYWKEKLQEIFPNPIISKCRYMVIGGAIGIGKSVCSKIMAAYDICKMAHLEDPYDTFKLDRTTGFTIRCFNIDKNKANEVLVNPLNELIQLSPYLNDVFSKSKSDQYGGDDDDTSGKLKITIGPAKRATDVISECMIFSLISEANFMKPDVAKAIVNECISRMSSRLSEVEDVFGHIVLDSSSTGKDSIVEEFIKNTMSQKLEMSKVIKAAVWEAKAHTGKYFNKGSFNVYLGDTNTKPHIIEKGEYTADYDPDRILNCPSELLAEFKIDIVKALNDMAGISLDYSSQFFPDKELLRECGCIDSGIEDELCFDFFDEEQIHDRIGSQILKLIPSDRKVYMRIDLGLVNDRCGISLGYIDSIKYDSIEGKRVFKPDIVFPVCFALSRKKDQETSIEKICNFIIWLSTQRDIGMLSTDQFQSSSIRQFATLNNIKNKLLSVDRTDTAYVNFKNQMLLRRIKFSSNDILFSELSQLVRVDANKIDHPPSSCFTDDTEVLVKCKSTGDEGVISIKDLIKVYPEFYIKSYNLSSNKFEYVDIDNVFYTKSVDELIELDFGEYKYRCTLDHKFLTNNGWVEAKDLTESEDIIC